LISSRSIIENFDTIDNDGSEGNILLPSRGTICNYYGSWVRMLSLNVINLLVRNSMLGANWDLNCGGNWGNHKIAEQLLAHREVSGSNPGPDTCYPDEGSSQSSLVLAGKYWYKILN
jgi:hypothetical protein